MAVNIKQRSEGLFDETEKPGQPFPMETQMIIRDRYDFAASMAQDKAILEVGCGSGLGLGYLAEHAKSLDCLEYSQENVNNLSAKLDDKIHLHQGDAHSMPFPDCKFDLIIALAMIYYLSVDQFLSEAERILTDRGSLFFCMSNKDVPGFVPAPYTKGYYSIPQMNNFLKKAGFNAQFFGAFPASNKSHFKRHLRAIIVTILKKTMQLFPGGIATWKKMRQSTLKDIQPLPDDVRKMPRYPDARIPLRSNQNNSYYRVIYVIAEKV